MRRYGLLIFDLDGTLFQAHTVTVPAMQWTFQEFGLSIPSTEAICSFFGRPSSEWHPWLRSLCPLEIADAVVAAVDRREMGLIAETGALYPGIREALAGLRGIVAQMALCTNGPQDYVEQVLTAHGLGAFFDLVRYRQADGKDKTAMVGELLARLPARPALVVGDRWDDIAAAQAHRLPAIAAAYGYGSAEEWRGAAALARSPAELPGLVRALLGAEVGTTHCQGCP